MSGGLQGNRGVLPDHAPTAYRARPQSLPLPQSFPDTLGERGSAQNTKGDLTPYSSSSRSSCETSVYASSTTPHTPSTFALPWWFSIRDVWFLQRLAHTYETSFELNTCRQRFCRQPLQYVSQVERRPITELHGAVPEWVQPVLSEEYEGHFKTVDLVTVKALFGESELREGCVVVWDEDGVPLKIVRPKRTTTGFLRVFARYSTTLPPVTIIITSPERAIAKCSFVYDTSGILVLHSHSERCGFQYSIKEEEPIETPQCLDSGIPDAGISSITLVSLIAAVMAEAATEIGVEMIDTACPTLTIDNNYFLGAFTEAPEQNSRFFTTNQDEDDNSSHSDDHHRLGFFVNFHEDEDEKGTPEDDSADEDDGFHTTSDDDDNNTTTLPTPDEVADDASSTSSSSSSSTSSSSSCSSPFFARRGGVCRAKDNTVTTQSLFCFQFAASHDGEGGSLWAVDEADGSDNLEEEDEEDDDMGLPRCDTPFPALGRGSVGGFSVTDEQLYPELFGVMCEE